MAITLPELPYGMDDLAPKISRETLEYHYGKHHQAYVTNLNKLIEGTAHAGKSLEEILLNSDGGVYNNAAQIWNHTFYWNCLSPKGGGEPGSRLAESLNKSFGSVGDFREQFTKAAATLFGSGWAFLVQKKDGSLAIEQDPNAGNPMTRGNKPLMTCDVWEHAYYVDYRNARPKYLDAFWDLVNWDFVEANLAD